MNLNRLVSLHSGCRAFLAQETKEGKQTSLICPAPSFTADAMKLGMRLSFCGLVIRIRSRRVVSCVDDVCYLREGFLDHSFDSVF